MNCPRCGAYTITRTLDPQQGAYFAVVRCDVCGRLTWSLTADPGDAIDAADELFYGEGRTDG